MDKETFLIGCFILTLNAVCSGKPQQGPNFIHEPASRVDFTNSSGASVVCSSRGNPPPIITWQKMDGSEVVAVSGLRELKPDGTLVFPPFRPSRYRQDVHAATYRCLATNSVGSIRSRDIHVRAVLLQPYDIRVYDQFVPRGNTAIMRCHVPAVVRDYVSVVLWVRDDGITIGPPGISSDKYAVLHSGELLIRNTEPSDAFRGYKCQTRHRLTNELITSSSAGQLIVTEPHSSLSPKVIENRSPRRAKVGDTVYLPCVGQGVPKPQSFWYKKQGNSLRSLSENHRGNHELLTFRKVSVQDGGGYICVVNNTVGREEFSTELVVTAPLSAHIQPATQLADVGRRASLTCRVSGHPLPTVSWYKDGRLLTFSSRVTSVSRDVVQIFTVQREDKGMYQCLATNELESYQATAEINIGEDAPVFTSTFPEVTTRPSMPLSLKCSASGKPLPQITWSLDGMAVPEAYHIRIGDYVSTEYTVNSYVNISSASVEDGGLYFCSATNDVGKVSHSARVNIFGPPYIRPMKNVSALAGKEVTLHCPVAGFPIEKIAWERESRRLPQSHRQHVYANGTLLLKQVLRSSDSGSYTCFAADKQGRTARREVHVSVLIPPAVEPFAFPKDLTEGKRAGVACVVSAGDLPISIRWVKDGQTLADELKASISNANDFTSFLSFSTVQQSHNGRYTCVASNPVASANYTATMTVHVPPKWRVEPNDKSAVLGESVTFDCQADGFPAPVIRWKRATGSDQGNFEVIISSANIQIRENGSLTIREVNKEDSGSYMCQATNGVGPGLSTVVHLKVHVAAHFGKRFEAQSIRKGEALMLACEAKGEKPITIVWTKDRHSFDPHMETRYILEEEDLEEAIKSVIRVPSADRRDSALFTCVAENTYGKDEITYQVIVQEPPDKPRNPSILAKGSRSFSVSWSHPYSGNSPLSAYILEYTRNTDPWEQSKKVNVEGSVNEFTVQNLIPQTTYRVRLFAENALGIGEPSELMTVTTEEEAPNGPPQEIRVTATSSKSLQVSWKPPSRKDWHGTVQGYYVGVKPYAGTEPFSYKTVEVRDSGTQECEINNLERHTKYVVVVQAFNAKGAGPTSAEVLEETLEFDPPIAPRLAVVSQTSTSIHVTWDSLEEDGEPVGGYILFYKTEESEWDEVTIPAERSSFNAQNLQCGKRYQLYIVAFNSAGRGQPSEVVPAKTDGSVPLAPDKSVLLSTNSSAVTLHLTSWESSTCPITFFVVQYKPRDQREWILLSNNILPAQKLVVIGDLSPATWYALLMTAHNDAGSTEAEYIFATLTLTGGTVPPLAISPDPGRELAQQLKIIIPIVCTTIVLVLIVTVSCVILIKRRNHNYANANNYQQAEEVRDQEVSKNLDTVPMTVWEKRPRTTADGRLLNQSREQLYFPSPYATSRVSMYSEYETGGGVGRDVGVGGGGGGDRVAVAANQLSWKVPPGAPGHPHPTHERIEHTYDVPFLRRQHHVPSETKSLCLQEAVVDLPPEHCDRPRSAVVPSTAIGAFVNSEQHFGYKPSRAHQRRARHRSEPRLRPLTHRPQRPRYSDGESDENGYSYSDVEESGVFHNCEEPEMSETESDRHLRALYYQRRNLQ